MAACVYTISTASALLLVLLVLLVLLGLLVLLVPQVIHILQVRLLLSSFMVAFSNFLGLSRTLITIADHRDEWNAL